MKWFRHFSRAGYNNDLKALINEWGLDWYGRWWLLVEMVAEDVRDDHLTFRLDNNDGSPVSLDLVARHCRTRVEQLSNFCGYLSKRNLIDPTEWNEKKMIFIPKVKELCDEWIRKVLKNSGATPEQEEEEEDKKKSIYGEDSFEFKAAKWFYDTLKKQFPTFVVQTFDQVQQPWCDALDKLQRIDNHNQDAIRRVMQFVRQDDFWSKQIRSIPKLREKDKQGTPYFNLMLAKAVTVVADKKPRRDGITIANEQRKLDSLLTKIKTK